MSISVMKRLMNQTEFKRTLSRAIVWPLLVMPVLAAVTIWQVGSLLVATQWVDHTDQVIALARLTQKQITDMQFGLRSYHFIPNPQYLQRYTQAHTAFDTDEKALEHLIADTPHQQRYLGYIRTDYARWFAMLNQYQALPARDYVALSKPTTDALNRSFDNFVAAEEDLRHARIQTARQGALHALVGTLISALLLGILLAFTNRRQLLGLAGSYERQAEALRASEGHLGITLKSIGDGVIATDAQGRIDFVNSVAERLTGWTQAEAQGHDLHEVFRIVDETTRLPVESPVEKVIREDQVVGLTGQALLLARGGLRTLIDATGAPIRNADGELRGVVLVFHNVSERRRLEDQLLQAQKLESIGRLAGGVAHDFNNLLTVILGYAELAQEECTLDADAQEYLANVKTAAEKASHLTGQLLAFARKHVIEPKVVQLNDLVLSLDKMLRRLIGEDIELVMLPADDLHCVKVDPGQFEQIVVNLVVNARDAMPEGGKITLETDNVHLDEEYARQHEGVVAGDYVLLAISDTGNGMEESVRLHIFEPFFTTKEKGRGTGLGLATVYGIVKQAGGHIWLYSEVGQGTTFRIYLPRTPETLKVTASPSSLNAPSGGSELLLLVEDEGAVRTLALETLRRQGYRVLEAMNGEEALRVAYGREHEIALLITDVVMPQMSGKELVNRLQRIHPGLKVLYASGYTENTIVHHGVLDPGIAFLSKPFTPSLLARRVREILDTPPVEEGFAVVDGVFPAPNDCKAALWKQ